MALEVKLVQKLSQNLLMTPQLQQAIKLLQLGRMEFIEAVEKELLENPILEESREDSGEPDLPSGERSNSDSQLEQELTRREKQAKDDSPVDWEQYLERFQDARGTALPKGTVDFDDRPSLEATLTKDESLTEYLVQQLRMAEITEREEQIALNVIGNLDEDGYLCSGEEEILESCDCTLEEAQAAIVLVKSFEPAGVGARNLSECLWIQLDNMGPGQSLAAKIVLEHMASLERRKYDQIAKQEQVAVEEVYSAITAIQSLEPRPGRPFNDDTIRYIVPDIYVSRVGGEYVISLNEDGLPKLRVSPYYLKLLQSQKDQTEENKEYLNERLKAASWLIKSIHQRQQTIYRVTESIVKFQREFLDEGVHKLKPLILKEVADDIGMHESTVSRVTTNKYVHTCQGVYELKYFFSSGIKTGDGDISSSYVKEKIRQLISEEDPEKPISDQKIVQLLENEGMKIARRTVAKYRENLGIASSSRRKKLF